MHSIYHHFSHQRVELLPPEYYGIAITSDVMEYKMLARSGNPRS
jgi:hypothetical protein